MTLEDFRQSVLKKLRVYAIGKSDQELTKAIEEYPDIITDGYRHYQGVEYGCDYAAWNISQCI